VPPFSSAVVNGYYALTGVGVKLGIRYLPWGELKAHREAIARFGSGLRPIPAISRSLGEA
jgi:hypothetical protein